MAVIEPYMVKTALGVGADTAVELTAKTGESLLIKDVIISMCCWRLRRQR